MTLETINKLCCGFDKEDLNLTAIHKTIEGHVEEGFLTCKTCKRIYLIVNGIPIMSPDEYREIKLEQPILEKWRDHLNDGQINGFRLLEKSY